MRRWTLLAALALAALTLLAAPALAKPAKPCNGLNAPTGLVATGKTDTTVSLRWTSSPCGSRGYYTVYTYASNGTTLVKSQRTTSDPSQPNTNAWVVKGLAAGTTYVFKVTVTKGTTESPKSSPVTVTTDAAPAPQPPPAPEPPAQCADGLDNDADKLVDYPADPGCSSTTDNDETNAVTPPSGTLTWAPPTCGDATHGCVDINIAANGHQTPALSSNNDYRLHLPSTPQQGGITINGGHNVIVIGGQINLTVPCTDGQGAVCKGIYVTKRNGPTGHVFVEGVWIHDPQTTLTQTTSDGIAVDDSTSQPTDLTLQNVRIDGISGCEVGGNHSDVLQTWYAGNARVHIDRFTGTSNCQGLQIDPDLAWINDGAFAKEYIIKNTNLVSLSSGGNDYLFWLTYNLQCNGGPITLQNVWSKEPNGTLSVNSVWPDTDQPAACKSVWNGTSQQLSFPNSPQISGSITEGLPPGGDFVPVGLAGTSYVSPGYQGG